MGCGASVQQQQADNKQATAQEPAAAPAAIVPPPAAASVGKPELARLELDADPVEEEPDLSGIPCVIVPQLYGANFRRPNTAGAKGF